MLAKGNPIGGIGMIILTGFVGLFMITNLSTDFGSALGVAFIVGGLIGGIA